MTAFDHRRHIASLDGIRGLAILAVLFFHLYPASERDPLSHLARAGWLGVDLFFVLSGFLITGILLDTRDDPRVFRNFYARRALRLLPLYVVLMLAIALVSRFALGQPFTRWTLPFFAYAANLVINFGAANGVAPLFDMTSLWSLAVEEQFYLLWPSVAVRVRRTRMLLWICIAGITLAVALRWTASFTHFFLARNADLELPLRLDSLLSGAALAVLVRSRRGRELLRRPLLDAMFAAAALGAALPFVLHPHLNMYGPLVARFVLLAAAIASAALIALALDAPSWAARLGRLRGLRFLGRYSYGIYLLHCPLTPWLYRYTLRRGPHTLRTHALSLALAAAYGAASIALAVVSYHALELPFLRRKRDFAYHDEQQVRHLQVDQAEAEPVRSS